MQLDAVRPQGFPVALQTGYEGHRQQRGTWGRQQALQKEHSEEKKEEVDSELTAEEGLSKGTIDMTMPGVTESCAYRHTTSQCGHLKW